MKRDTQKGFSLVELLVVVVIIGIIAAIAIPYLKKAKYASENAAMLATMRTMASAQVEYYSQNSRYATLSELNNTHANAYGIVVGNNLKRGSFTMDMGSVTPTDPSLKNDFTITATKTLDAADLPYIISVNATGRIVQITP